MLRSRTTTPRASTSTSASRPESPLTNQDTVSHNVTGIAVSGVTFNLVTAAPDPSTSSPTVVASGATVSFGLTIQASPFSGSYTLSGTITTE